jgi:hypothetical protein
MAGSPRRRLPLVVCSLGQPLAGIGAECSVKITVRIIQIICISLLLIYNPVPFVLRPLNLKLIFWFFLVMWSQLGLKV